MKAKEWVGCWEGQTVACIGSGPSLTAADCETVHRMGWKTIVTNTTFLLAPWADVLFAHDLKWWKWCMKHHPEELASFKGRQITASGAGPSVKAETIHVQPWMAPCGNSGATALVLAVHSGAGRIILLGMDCQATGGKMHHHGDHPPELGNARSMGNWAKHFKTASRVAGKTPVINCSRATALKCFPRADLETELEVETC